MDLAEAKRVIEAVIFAADEPVSVDQFAQLLETLDNDTILQVIQGLQQDYAVSERSFQLV